MLDLPAGLPRTMTPDEQVSRCNDEFVDALHSLIDYYGSEWKMTFAQALGCLELVKANLIASMPLKDVDDDEE